MAALNRLLPLAFSEDEGEGDITGRATIPPEERSTAHLLAKAPGRIAGLPLLPAVFAFRGVPVRIDFFVEEGSEVGPGRRIATLTGPTRDLLVCERIFLNFLQRLSGIATATASFAALVAGTRTAILDTRKTLPGHRLLDKYAVAVGGGRNHRIGLFDQVLIKDNHIRACGSVRAAVDRAKAAYGSQYRIEAEVESLAELETLFGSGVDIVMLDNMGDAEMAACVKRVRETEPRILLEASGNMNPERVLALRDHGLDFISIGSLTHSVTALDLSLRFEGGQNGP